MVLRTGTTDQYEQDIETWEELRNGEQYTVAELLERQEAPRSEEIALNTLYPTPVTDADVEVSNQVHVPTYDHDNEEIRLQDQDIATAIDELDAFRQKGTLGRALYLHLPGELSAMDMAESVVERYEEYTVTVEE